MFFSDFFHISLECVKRLFFKPNFAIFSHLKSCTCKSFIYFFQVSKDNSKEKKEAGIHIVIRKKRLFRVKHKSLFVNTEDEKLQLTASSLLLTKILNLKH